MATTASHSSVCIDSQKGVTDPVQAVPARRDRRVRNRFQCEGLTCTLGDVIGLSGSGMRVSARGWCRYKAHDRLSLTLTQFGAQLSLIARVAWVRRHGVHASDCRAERCARQHGADGDASYHSPQGDRGGHSDGISDSIARGASAYLESGPSWIFRAS
jgi:hypothetical protein